MIGTGVYRTEDEFLEEFVAPEDREGVKQRAAQLIAENHGARLAELREQAHLDQEEAARRMGVSTARVAEIESGRDASLNVIKAFLLAIGYEDVELTAVRNGNRFRIA
ncbi:hypothetical protein GCM10020367_50180 [Streptomyces sannanensis]|uniref:HTH cro/C1-type domain-containing protein n=1 Tax=Streptomyces sannanensis TaxID=285536 RepID=A0ABP6SHU3_9ACTN